MAHCTVHYSIVAQFLYYNVVQHIGFYDFVLYCIFVHCSRLCYILLRDITRFVMLYIVFHTMIYYTAFYSAMLKYFVVIFYNIL